MVYPNTYFEENKESTKVLVFFYVIILTIRTSDIHKGSQGTPKWQPGSEKGFTHRFFRTPVKFRSICFLLLQSSYEKVGNGAQW